MFDWKIIAAVFIALVAVSYVVIGVPGIGEFFGDLASKAGKALEGSPFGGLFSSGAGKAYVEVTLYPDSLSLKPELPVNISAGNMELRDFRGEISVDLENGTISMKQEGSSLVITPRLELVAIEGLKISRLSLEGIKASVKSGDTNTMIENGTLEILDFLGRGSVSREYVGLSGNATKVRGDGWEIG